MTNNAAFGFWAITVYSLPDRKLVDNPANKYQLNSRNPDFNKWCVRACCCAHPSPSSSFS